MTENIDFDPSTVLAETIPDFLREGPLLVEFKDSTETIKSAVLVTLSPEFCNLDDIPVDNCDEYNIWVWNVHRGGWINLSLRDVETVQTWPPEF